MSDSIDGSYPPLTDYAVIGDCRTAALVSRAGSIEWLCLPDYSDPSVFAAILDRRLGGSFRVSPDQPFSVQRQYIGDTCVLETRFTTSSGVLVVADAMTIPTENGLYPQRELLRRIEVLAGTVDLEIVFEPRPGYGQITPAISNRGALGWTCAFGDSLILLRSELPLEAQENGIRLEGHVSLGQGECRFISLAFARRDIGIVLPLGRAAEGRHRATIQYWREWSGGLRYDGPWRESVMRSALTLKLLSCATTGAVIAAPTASLPEVPGGTRNWDYRFCWLRDASLTVEAFLSLGCSGEAQAFLGWMLHATRLTHPRLQVLYDIYGSARVPEKELTHLEGHARSRPVRIGNGAWRQRQLDVYGEVCRAAHLFVDHGSKLDAVQARALAGFGRAICRDWQLPDHGIWEVRGPPRQHTHSKVLCWAALDCLLALARQGHIEVERDRLEATREAVRTAIETRGFNRSFASYADVLDGTGIDSALLLMAHYGYLPENHPRVTGTFARIERELGRDELVWRCTNDGLSEADNPFGICCFWAVDYLARLGRLDEAARRFERLLTHANDVGLFGEEIDATTGEPRGNFPQGFTHTGLIVAAQSITRSAQ
jgi:GH15 family glucan-1,4-alpha-glucosidase